MKGHPFTEKGRGTTHFEEEKLDRALASMTWATQFAEATISNLVATCSDHSPLLLATELPAWNKSGISFRFENRWMEEVDFINFVTDKWGTTTTTETIIDKLNCLSTDLVRWSRKHPKINRQSIEELKKTIDWMRSNTDQQSISKVEDLKLKLNKMMQQSDIYWKQRAKQFWLKDGDLNTKFFHSMATKRKACNRIHKLMDNTGVEFSDPQNLGRIALDYFEQIFSAGNAAYEAVTSQIEPKISNEDNAILLSPFTKNEFQEALFQMDPNKSPGPDGYNPAFFQKCWHLMGEEFFNQCEDWM